MPKILISYRRSDTAGVAGRIFDRLVARFGHEFIFMDVDHIPFGIDFRDHIRETLLAGDMLLAIVGHRWLGQREGARARMHDDNDPVRVEIETALQNGVTLIPVLVDGAPMPAPDELPSALEKFSYLNAAPVDTGRDFHQHMDRLIRTIERILESKAGNAQAAPAATAVPVATSTPAPVVSATATHPSAARKWMIAGGIAALVIVVALASLFGFWNAPTQQPTAGPDVATFTPPSGPPIRIGLAIVQSGLGAPQGKEILLAMKIWQEDVNARGGLLGRPVEIVAHDDEGNPANVPSLYARLIDIDKVDIVVSGWPTFLIMQALPVVMQRNKLFLGLLGLEANQEANYPRYFSMSPVGPTLRSVLTQGLFNIAMEQNPKPRSVAITAVDEAVCNTVTEGAREQARAAGLPVVYDDTYANTTADFAPIVNALAARNPDLVVVCFFGGDVASFVRAVDRQGFKPRMIGGAMPSLRSADIKAELGPLLNGWINFDYWLPAPRMQFPGAASMLSRYQSRARDEGAEPTGHQLALWSYARMQVLQQAVDAIKGLDDTRLADHIRNATFKTVVGDVRFGDRGEWAQPRILQVQFQNIRGNDIEQFRDPRTQVILDPPGFASGDLIYPFADARK